VLAQYQVRKHQQHGAQKETLPQENHRVRVRHCRSRADKAGAPQQHEYGGRRDNQPRFRHVEHPDFPSLSLSQKAQCSGR